MAFSTKRRRPTRTRVSRQMFVNDERENNNPDASQIIPDHVRKLIEKDQKEGCTLWFMALVRLEDVLSVTIGLLTSRPLITGENLGLFRKAFLNPDIRFLIAALALPPEWFPRFSRETVELLAMTTRELPLEETQIATLLKHVHHDIPELERSMTLQAMEGQGVQ